MLAGSSVTLLIGGSIAAYKSAELVRELIRRKATVRVAMSKAAREFITPLTLQTLSGSPVTCNMFDEQSEADIGHIKLADSADLILVVPATADMIAKAAAGIADDIVSTVLLASTAPKIFVPAMNVNMWKNPLTQRNVQTLRDVGVHVVEPESGELACGWIGAGRLAEIDCILDNVEDVLTQKDLVGSRVLVTAGPTVEQIDPIRFVSNRSSGKMGHALARIAKWRGAEVTLVSGPSNLLPPAGVDFHQVSTAEQMHEKVFDLLLDCRQKESGKEAGEASDSLSKQYVFMVAAVTDHRPADFSTSKVKNDKKKSYELKLEPCPDILQELGERKKEIEKKSGRALKLIGFSAETGDERELLQFARNKLEKKNADLIVGNFAEDSFGKDTNRVWLLGRNGKQEEISTADKDYVAGKIVSASCKL